MTDKNWAGIELGKRNLHIHTSIICQFHEQFDFNFSCHSSWEARSGAKSDYPDPTMMLLMGMKMSLTKKPMKPMTINPMAVLIATFENSRRSGLWHFLTSRMLSFVNSLTGRTTVSTASILFFPSLLPILYTLSFSFLPAPPKKKEYRKTPDWWNSQQSPVQDMFSDLQKKTKTQIIPKK